MEKFTQSQGKRGGARANSGPKPGAKYRKHGDGIRILPKAKLKAKWLKVLELAEEAGDVGAMIRALTQISEMQHGRPYVAENPNQGKREALSDPRLQDAISKLLPGSTVTLQQATISPANQVQIPGKSSANDPQDIRKQSAHKYAEITQETAPACIDAPQVIENTSNV